MYIVNGRARTSHGASNRHRRSAHASLKSADSHFRVILWRKLSLLFLCVNLLLHTQTTVKLLLDFQLQSCFLMQFLVGSCIFLAPWASEVIFALVTISYNTCSLSTRWLLCFAESHSLDVKGHSCRVFWWVAALWHPATEATSITLVQGRHLQSFIRIELWTCARGTLKRPKLKGLGRLLVTNGQAKVQRSTFLICHEGRLSTTLLLCVRETLTGGCRIRRVGGLPPHERAARLLVCMLDWTE